MKYLKYIFLVCYIFLTLVIFLKSIEDGDQSSASSDQVTDIIVGTIDGITQGDESITDKFDIKDIKLFIRKAIGHFGIFLVLGIFSCLTYYYFIRNKTYAVVFTIIAGIFTAIISELLQAIPSDRNPSFNDILIDFSGYLLSIIIIGLIIYLPMYIKFKKVVSN